MRKENLKAMGYEADRKQKTGRDILIKISRPTTKILQEMGYGKQEKINRKGEKRI